MPFEIAFVKPVGIVDRDQYINDCCIGGDIVVDALLPAIQRGYTRIDTNQEDWGWFIWFRKGNIKLAVDVFADDCDAGVFRIRLTSSKTSLLVFTNDTDTPELDELRDLVVAELKQWQAIGITTTKDEIGV
jgi:hypothetical protein